MPLTTETQAEESNPFAVFETAAQILGFIFHKFGQKGLRELLVMLQGQVSCESLQDAADELSQAGLQKPASVISELASTFPHEIDLNPHPPNTPEWNKWHNLRLKLDKIRTRQRKTKTGDAYARLRSPTK